MARQGGRQHLAILAQNGPGLCLRGFLYPMDPGWLHQRSDRCGLGSDAQTASIQVPAQGIVTTQGGAQAWVIG